MNAFTSHGIDHLSASSINLFAAQPALWAANYLLGKRVPVGAAAHRGTAIETGVEAGLFDPEMPVAEAQRIGLEKFHALTRLSGDPKREKELEVVAPSIGVALAELRQYGIPDSPEEGRQHKISVQLDGIPVPFEGWLDFEFGGHGIIVDLKTTQRIPSEISAPHSRQGSLYTKARGGNMHTRMAYVSAKKIAVYAVEDVDAHLARTVAIARCIERFLSLSDDRELLARCIAPDMSSFYFNDVGARSLAAEVWGL